MPTMFFLLAWHALLVDYFQVVRMFLIFSFFLGNIFFPDISLCNIFLFADYIILIFFTPSEL